MSFIIKTIELSDGRVITLETGKLAKQADGAVLVRMGKAMILATVVTKTKAEDDPGFLPLYVDYQEKFAGAGKIPGSFLRREGRMGDHEVLIARLVDRAIRPLFPKTYRHETQICLSLISADKEVLPDALAALAASAALTVSPVPFMGPISEVRVARIAGEFCINPTPENLARADIDLIVGANMESILMIEGEMREVQEEEMVDSIQFAHAAIKEQCRVQQSLAQAVGMASYPVSESSKLFGSDLYDTLRDALYDKIYAVIRQCIPDKNARRAALEEIRENYIKELPESHEIDTTVLHSIFQDIEREAVRSLVLKERVRLDGRKLDQVRAIDIEVDYLPSAHGSALFTRGATQSLTTVTLGSKLNEQIIDRVMTSGYSKFMLHYNFPGFSTGDVKPNRGPSRREIGHGNLAMRALQAVLPQAPENPYTIRIVSDILESNGSSSMATVCASSLALMDAGVRIKAQVSGIAMGLVMDEATGTYAILTDILGDEDHLGDMDFKVAGTHRGLTACQMDIKIAGISYQILKEALAQSKVGRLHILDRMNASQATVREDYKAYVPRISTLSIAKDMIGAVIGPGGKVIQEIQRKSGATVLVEEEEGKGIVNFFSADKESLDKATQLVKDIVAEPTVGEVYTGKVKTIKDFGAFVEFMPGKDGLLHISEVKWERIAKMEGVLEEGEELQVKLTEIDPKTGKYRLSRKVLLPKPTGAAAG